MSLKNSSGSPRLRGLVSTLCPLLVAVAALALALPASAQDQADEPDAATDAGDREASPDLVDAALKPWTGDFDEMVKRRVIRVLVTFSKTHYFIDRGRQRGITYDFLKQFEDDLNKQLKTGTFRIHVAFVPVRRDQLLSGLVEGRGDIACANLTVTEARLKLVDFTRPAYTGVNEVLVTGPAALSVAGLDDLSGKEIFVRKSSSYYESLVRLNRGFATRGIAPVAITPADEDLEDEDLMEMVNAGLIPMIVVDNHKAELWAQIFDQIKVHADIAVRTGGEIACAIRKNSPKAKEAFDRWLAAHGKGTLLGNTLIKRYFKTTKYLRNAASEQEMAKFRATVELFKKYAGLFDFDYLMVMAQAYQESHLDQSVKSPVGAIGIMQVLPTTAAGAPILIRDVQLLENNIHAGVKYLRFLVDEYFDEPGISPVNRLLFAFASYNGGPNRIARLRREAAAAGYDPDKWFQNVEVIVAKRIGRETVTYVGNIFKYYIAYNLIERRSAERQEAVEALEAP